MVQQERKKLLEAEIVQQESAENALNYFAPTKNLKVLLTEEWFGMLAADEKRFTAKWIHSFVDALMASEWRDQIAADWAVVDKRLFCQSDNRMLPLPSQTSLSGKFA